MGYASPADQGLSGEGVRQGVITAQGEHKHGRLQLAGCHGEQCVVATFCTMAIGSLGRCGR